ncbi:MAG: phosphoadenylyl-sulfate reductase [Caldilineaceae bacterium]
MTHITTANPILSTSTQSNLAPLAPHRWAPANLTHIARRFEKQAPPALLNWAAASFGQDLVMATGFGPSGVVLMHMVSEMSTVQRRFKPAVFYLQTDLLFPETLALRDRLAEQMGIRFVEVHSGLSLAEQALRYGAELWQQSPNLCCQLRKVNPLREFLSNKRAWITGIRRDQSSTRASAPLVMWDEANQLVKLNPLAGWSSDQIWTYIYQHNLPYNALHDQGYPSIGCTMCTRAVRPGEDERAGRWAGLGKTECGIHIQPDGKVVRVQ